MPHYMEQGLFRCAHQQLLDAQLHHKSFPLPGDQPHYTPDRNVDITHIRLDLSIDFEQRSIEGTATLDVEVIAPNASVIEFDADELDVRSVTVSIDRPGIDSSPTSQTVDFYTRELLLVLPLAQSVERGAKLRFVIAYRAQPRRGLYFVQPDAAYPHKQIHAWTQGQDLDARAWFPCFTLPDAKATTELIVTVPNGMFALSNGELVERTTDQGSSTFHWRENTPHSAYLVTLVAGPFVELQDEWEGVPVNYYVLPGREADGLRAMSRTPQMIDYFSNKIGVRYPYEKYAQICVSDFIMGGMENTSATTLTDTFLPDERVMPDFVNESLVAHELAHQWFGDLLTCREWSDGWLNEGFATYFEAVWKQHIDGEDEFRYALHEKAELYLAEDRGRYRRPIVTRTYNEPIDIFDMHLYPKGALVLHMLRYQLGDDNWWRAINHYVVKHRESTVVTYDLQRAIQEATGRNFDKFFDQFVFTGGHPEFDVSYSWDDTNRTAKLHVKQAQQLDALTPLFDLPVIVYFETKQQSYEYQIRVNVAEQMFAFVLPERPEMVRFDRHGDILKTLTFPRSVEMLMYQLEHDSTIAGRIEAAHDLGKLGSHKAVDALAAALHRETFWGVRIEIVKALGEARTSAAKDILLAGLAIEHSRVRRAVVEALGNWKRDQPVADALWQRFETGDTSYFVEAEIGKALGRLKVGASFERAVAALERSSWNDVVQMHVLTGLGALRDVRGVAVALDWSRYGHGLWARVGAITALGELGQLDAVRVEVVEHLSDLLSDPVLRVREASARALGKIGDVAAVPALERTIARDADGRVIRLSREAIQAIKAGSRQTAELTSLRSDVDALKEENRKLRDRLDVVEATAAPKEQR